MSEGDRAAVGELYELISADVFAFALSRLCDRTDAEDVLHDTFVKLFKYSSRYEPRGKPMAWILTVTLNTARRHTELKRRHISYDESIGEQTPSGESLEDALVSSELLKSLFSVLDDSEREIVVLHAVSGLRHREIAALLGLPLSTALSKYNRAIKKLKRAREAIDEEN